MRSYATFVASGGDDGDDGPGPARDSSHSQWKGAARRRSMGRFHEEADAALPPLGFLYV